MLVDLILGFVTAIRHERNRWTLTRINYHPCITSERTNSAKARKAITKVGGMILKIPAGSPDLNPIENFFNIVAKDLKKQAVVNNIRKETFEQFSERVKQTMFAFPVEKN